MRIFYITMFNFLWIQSSFGQLSKGSVFPNVVSAEIANENANKFDLYKNNATITVLDFFGTWCAPCIKAIPQLKNYQSKFKNDISIALISIEQIDRLKKFVTIQKDLPFYVLADVEKGFHNIAAPPSYPFTLILSKSFKILAITNTSEINEEKISNWIIESKNEKLDLEKIDTIKNNNTIPQTNNSHFSDNQTVQLSQEFLLAIKSNEDASNFKSKLANLAQTDLTTNLKTNSEKIAFWLNIYNAFTNETLKKNPEQYKNRKQFFKNKFITIAGKQLSLDDIEHGILRRSKHKLSMGYFNKWCKSKFEKANRVDTLDWRIHFALNCGAKSCPPIAFYTSHNLNNELNSATKNYLTSECEWDAAANTIKVPVLFSWFRKDFGGKKKIHPILQEFNILPKDQKPKIIFKKYNWDILVENYSKQ